MIDNMVVCALVGAESAARHATTTVRQSVRAAALKARAPDEHAAVKINPAYRAQIACRRALCMYLIYSMSELETVRVYGEDWDKERVIAELGAL